MITAGPKELYRMFLASDWWIALSRRKRRKVGKCERCGSKVMLQAHHKVYRENWFDTTLEDLECVCRKCHLEEHGLDGPYKTIGELVKARCRGEISRSEFVQWKKHFPVYVDRPKRPNKKRNPDGWKKHYRLNEYGIYVPRIMTRIRRWKNYGRSSN